MANRSEYAPINGSHAAGGNSPIAVALLFVIAALAIAILVLSVMLFRTSNDLKRAVHNVQPPAPFTNLDFTKDDLTNYYTTQHLPVVTGLVAQWTSYFQTFLTGKNAAASNMTVVFDIDETSLNNYPYYAPSSVFANGTDYGFVYDLWNTWTNSEASQAIAPVHTFYNWLLSQGVQCVFITGRRDTQEQVTHGNLLSQGYIPEKGPAPTLILRPPTFYYSTAEQYKSYYRQQLTNEGANIIGCIGDQVSDCNNGYAGYIMKIPNYLYYIE